ncbi:MAG: response regulator, partial [Burkholderiales bacterium]
GLLGHRVHLRSQAGRGSCFMVGLPRAQAPVPQATAPRVVPQPLAGLRVVVVDDDPSVLAALTDRLRQWGALVQAHASLTSMRSALVLAAAEPDAGMPLPRPDLLVTDQRLPDGSGLETAALMRLHHADLPVLVITGNTQTEELALLQASHLPVLHKPFRAEALLAAIQRVLRPLPSHVG